MMARKFSFIIFYSLFGLFAVDAQVRLPRLIRDSMILQRDTKLKIWGWVAKDERVTINFNGKTHKIKTGKDGKWLVALPPMKAGGSYAIKDHF